MQHFKREAIIMAIVLWPFVGALLMALVVWVLAKIGLI